MPVVVSTHPLVPTVQVHEFGGAPLWSGKLPTATFVV
jgi:hypothetical protein